MRGERRCQRVAQRVARCAVDATADLLAPPVEFEAGDAGVGDVVEHAADLVTPGEECRECVMQRARR